MDKFKKVLKDIYFSFVWLMVLMLAIDLISKWIIEKNVSLGQSITVIPNFFEITKSYNVGMAFSIGANGELHWRIIFIAISVIFSAVLIWYYIKKFSKLGTWKKVSLSLMIAGAVGNLIDRAFYWKAITGFDGVIDFLQFYIFGYPFATFNIADASLVVGVFILIILLIIEMIKEAKEKAKRGEYKMTTEEYFEKLNKEENKDSNEEDNNK